MQHNIETSGSHSPHDTVPYSEGSQGEHEIGNLQQTSSSKHPECIAICTVGELFGGVERHVLGLISGLAARGVSSLLILFHDCELAAQARGQGIEPVILSNHNRSVFATSRHLARLFKQHSIRIVHVHGYKATVFCALARLWCSFAMIKTVHGLSEPTAAGLIRRLRAWLYNFLEWAAIRMAHATIAYVTEDLRSHYRRAHRDLRMMVIPNGVANMDRSQFPRPPELHNDWFNVVMIGRLDIVKGPHVAIEAIASEHVPEDVHLYTIGTGPCETELRTLAETRGIASRVHLLGFRRNIYDYLAHCRMLLMPSLHEGLPYTLLEAMAFGIPTIATPVGGLAEVIRDGITGLLVAERDPACFARAIQQLHMDSELRMRLGKQARALQQSRYSLESMTEHYLELYRTISLVDSEIE